jgi:PAS domain S-box-containing protein
VKAAAEALHSMDLEEVLEHINVPSYVIDADGIIRWVNPAARRLVGDVAGRQFTSVVAPENTRRARELFARKIVGGTAATEAGVVILDRDGRALASRSHRCPFSTEST